MEISPSQEFVITRSYVRWLDDQKRRETWVEAVKRYFDFMRKHFSDRVPKKVLDKCEEAFANMEAMGSMRALWAAGEALERDNIAAYNCCYLPIRDLRSFAEAFYILMCGTGVGFSVEQEYIKQLPAVKRLTGEHLGVHVIGDSKEGWTDALMVGLEAWFDGKDIDFDASKCRAAGARLKTMGGRASGPAPLLRMLERVKKIVLQAQGRQLTDVEVLDLANHVAMAVVVGGVRRSSQISFSDIDSDGMRHAKDFPAPDHRAMSNNSAVYMSKPNAETFLREWSALVSSGTGERGIFNVKAAMNACERRAEVWGKAWEKKGWTLRTNPCGEILLLPYSFCNLSEIVVRADDTFADLIEKAKSAVWMGAMQSALTDFKFIRPAFKENCEKERLLGISLTGQMDNPKLLTAQRLADLKEIVLKEVKKASKALGINFSAAITCGKPSGTVSQAVNCASGAHARYAHFYLRRYRISAVDPQYRMLKDQGLSFFAEVGQRSQDVESKRKEFVTAGRTKDEAKILVPDWTEESVRTWVCEFPEKAPAKALTRHDVSALDQLEWYLKLKKNWCEHNQSMTVYVRDEEWLKVGAWVYDHFDDITGITFLPFDGGHYELAPYEEITEAEYEKRLKSFPKLDYSQLGKYEEDDNTTGAQQFACGPGGCEMA